MREHLPLTDRYRGTWRISAFIWLALAGLPCAAQTAPAPPAKPPAQPGPQDYRHVVSACAADYARLCTQPQDHHASGRDQAICLKYYRADLTLACRHAVAAVTH